MRCRCAGPTLPRRLRIVVECTDRTTMRTVIQKPIEPRFLIGLDRSVAGNHLFVEVHADGLLLLLLSLLQIFKPIEAHCNKAAKALGTIQGFVELYASSCISNIRKQISTQLDNHVSHRV